jgi:hypothetical protein
MCVYLSNPAERVPGFRDWSKYSFKSFYSSISGRCSVAGLQALFCCDHLMRNGVLQAVREEDKKPDQYNGRYCINSKIVLFFA